MNKIQEIEDSRLSTELQDAQNSLDYIIYLDKTKKQLDAVRDSRRFNLLSQLSLFPRQGYFIDRLQFDRLYQQEFYQPEITSQQAIQLSWQAKQIISQYEIFVKNYFEGIKRFSLLLSQRKKVQYLHDNFLRKINFCTLPGRMLVISTNNGKIATLQGPPGSIQQYCQAHCFSCVIDQGASLFVGFACSEREVERLEKRKSTDDVLQTVQSYNIGQTKDIFNELRKRHQVMDYRNNTDIKTVIDKVLQENYTFDLQRVYALRTLTQLQSLYPVKRFNQYIKDLENINDETTIFELYQKLLHVITRIKNYVHNSNLERIAKGLNNLDLKEDYEKSLNQKHITVVQQDPITLYQQSKLLK